MGLILVIILLGLVLLGLGVWLTDFDLGFVLFGVGAGIETLALVLVLAVGLVQLVWLKENKEFDRKVEYYYYLVEENETKDLDLLVEQVKFEIEQEIYKARYYNNFWLNWFNNKYVGSYKLEE